MFPMTCSQSYFPPCGSRATNLGGQCHFQGNGNPKVINGQSATWIAPLTKGTYTLTVEIDDEPGAMGEYDGGSRDDSVLTRTVNVEVVPKVWDKGLAIGKKRVTKPDNTTEIVDDGRFPSCCSACTACRSDKIAWALHTHRRAHSP